MTQQERNSLHEKRCRIREPANASHVRREGTRGQEIIADRYQKTGEASGLEVKKDMHFRGQENTRRRKDRASGARRGEARTPLSKAPFHQ